MNNKQSFQQQNIDTKKLLEASQTVSFPYFIDYYGLKIRVDEGVFSPKYFDGWKVFNESFPSFEGKRVLEVGTGTGVTALYLAKEGAEEVVAVDINEKAVTNAEFNKSLNDILNVDVRFSDLFSGIKSDEKFDIIYWNMPFGYVDESFVHENVLERSIFDPGYNILKRFVAEGPEFLHDLGYLLIGTGSGADIDLFNEITSNYNVELLAKVDSMEVNPVDFQLYKVDGF